MASQQGIRAGKAFVELYANDDKLVRGLRSAQRKLKRFGAMITGIGGRLLGAATAITGPIIAATSSFANFGDSVNKMSARTGLGAKAVSSLGFAAEQTGSDIKTLELGFRGMARFILNAERDLSTATDSLDDLGLSLDDLQGKSPEDQFKTIANSIAAVEDPSKQAALAMSIFGRSGSMLLPLLQGGAKGISTLQAEAEALGITLSDEDAKAAADLTDAMNRLKRALFAAWINGGSALADGITKLSDYIANTTKVVSNYIKNNKSFIANVAKIGAVIGIAGGALIALGATVGVISFAMGGLATAAAAVGTILGVLASPMAGLVAVIVAGVAAVTALTMWFIKSWDAVKKFGKVILSVLNVFSTYLSSGIFQTAGKLLWASLKVVWMEGITDLNKTWDKLKEAWSGVADDFVMKWKNAISQVNEESKKLSTPSPDDKKDKFLPKSEQKPVGRDKSFGGYLDWLSDGISSIFSGPAKPAEEGLVEVFKLTNKQVKDQEAKDKKSVADNTPIMPEFAEEEDPATKAAREKLAALTDKMANLKVESPTLNEARYGDNSTKLRGLISFINRDSSEKTIDEIQNTNSLLAELILQVKNGKLPTLEAS